MVEVINFKPMYRKRKNKSIDEQVNKQQSFHHLTMRRKYILGKKSQYEQRWKPDFLEGGIESQTLHNLKADNEWDENVREDRDVRGKNILYDEWKLKFLYMKFM